MNAYHDGNKSAKAMAIITLVFLRKNNPHPKKSISLAKSYIDSVGTKDALPGINLLYRLGDPSWREYYAKGLDGSDPSVRESYQSYGLNVLKLNPSSILSKN